MKSFVNVNVVSDLQGLAQLRHAAREPNSDTLREVAQRFEALFMKLILKGMRQTQLASDPFESEGGNLYRDMFDDQIAKTLSKRGGLGIADILVRQLGKEAGHETQARKASMSHALTRSPQEFVQALWPHAKKAADNLGVSPRVLLAQAALETGWGRHVATHGETSSYNVFGIKANRAWPGARTTVPTVEHEDGIVVRRREAFRAYESLADSFDDYAAFLRNNPRYSAALKHTNDPPTYVQALQDAGYATDPNYGRKITNILNGSVLGEALAKLKQPNSEPLPSSIGRSSRHSPVTELERS